MILTGCVRVPPVTLCNGTNAYELSCPGSARSYADCRNKAAEICGGKYKELTLEAHTSVVSQIGGALVAGRERRLNIICIKE